MKTAFLLLLATVVAADGAILHVTDADDFQSSRDANVVSLLFNFTNEITIAMWMKFTTTNGPAAPGQRIISKGEMFAGSGKNQFDVYTGSTAHTKLHFSYDNPDNTAITWQTTDNIVQTNEAFHLAIVFHYGDGSSFKMYTNGVETPGSWIAGTGNQAGKTNAVTFRIAADGAAVSGYDQFNGWTSEVAVWNAVLSRDQIVQLYKSRVKGIPKQIQPDRLRSYYPSDDSYIFPTASGIGLNRSTDQSFTTAFSFPSRFHRLDSGGRFIGEKVMSYQPNE